MAAQVEPANATGQLRQLPPLPLDTSLSVESHSAPSVYLAAVSPEETTGDSESADATNSSTPQLRPECKSCAAREALLSLVMKYEKKSLKWGRSATMLHYFWVDSSRRKKRWRPLWFSSWKVCGGAWK